MVFRKRQHKEAGGKQVERKKSKNLEKENDESSQSISSIADADTLMMQQLDDVFMVKHPPELCQFWRHAIKLNPKKPKEAFLALDSLMLAGPFLLIADHHQPKEAATNKKEAQQQRKRNYLLETRFPTDLPEMETVLVHSAGRFCYWRDAPEEVPKYLVHVSDGGDKEQHFPSLTICGERNLFAALQYLLTTAAKKHANAEKIAHLFPDNYDLNSYGPSYLQTLKKCRAKESVGMPFHGIGIKVAINNKGIGYRPLSEDKAENARLKRNIEMMGTTDSEETKTMLREKFCQLYTWVQFANDEMDFGMGLEFGHNLFISNYACFDGMAKSVLMMSYKLLGRNAFATILEKHSEVRR